MLPRRLESSCRKSESKREIRIVNNPLLADLLSSIDSRHADLCIRKCPQGGRIINNGSISAHAPRPHTIAYSATKHAVTGITKSIALDGRVFNIACSQIDIGNAATSLTERMNRGVLQADGSTATEARMDVTHVANAVVHMASLPLEANILNMTIMATTMPFVGRG
jgi:NADP-dependent 3-hydroxy acid dehydrogenase YdfG